jgi:hypothetical protein
LQQLIHKHGVAANASRDTTAVTDDAANATLTNIVAASTSFADVTLNAAASAIYAVMTALIAVAAFVLVNAAAYDNVCSVFVANVIPTAAAATLTD